MSVNGDMDAASGGAVDADAPPELGSITDNLGALGLDPDAPMFLFLSGLTQKLGVGIHAGGPSVLIEGIC